MSAKWILGVVGMVVATGLGACAAPASEAVGGDRASVTAAAFDKNAVLTDTALRDSAALSAADIQAFLTKTPWGHASVLATYEENGKSAAEIMHEAADKHGINPLELLVRVQMEQSLVYKKTASAEAISIAFGCGCPHSPVCSSKYEGFANQAECAAGTLSRSMDRAMTSNGTASGWKRGEEKLTQDKVEIVPQNAATAALYTYTPWVGEAGGGKKGVGGASLHYQIWQRFADATSYGVVAQNNNDAPRQAEVLEAGPAPEGNGGNDGNNDPGNDGTDEADASTPPPAPAADAGAPKTEPAPKTDSADAGPTTTDPSDDGTDDDDILGEGNAPPSNSAPLPKSSGSSKSRSSGGDEDELTEATEEELAGKKKSTGGCSTSGSHGGSDAGLIGLGIVAASLVASRRRRSSK